MPRAFSPLRGAARSHPFGAPPLRPRDKNTLVVEFCRAAVVGLTEPEPEPEPEPPKTKKPRYREALLVLVGPGGWFRVHLPRALSPLRGAAASLWRPKCSCGRILSNHAILTQTYSSKTKKPRYREALLVLVGPGGFEPPTSTMSRLPGLTETRLDTTKLAYFSCREIEARCFFYGIGSLVV